MARILLIDDDASLRGTMSRMLVPLGHEVFEAADGKQGLVRFWEIEPDVVVCDVILPERDGIEIVNAVKAARPTTRVLAISGGGQKRFLELLRLAKDMGADAALEKPFRKLDFVDAITRLCRPQAPGDPSI